MKIEVKDETLEKATECKHHYICMAVGGKPHCKISESVGESVFFTESCHPLGCPYQCSFGSSFLCTCPVRQEIFKK